MKLKRDYRIPEAALLNATEKDRSWIAIEEAWNAYADCPASQMAKFFRCLTPGQRAFVALNGLEAEVNNGGVHQYFSNSTGNIFQEAVAGLKLIGADAHWRLLRKVLKLFPAQSVLTNRSARQKVLKKIDTNLTGRLFDEPYFALEARKRNGLARLRLAYLRKHPMDFVLPPGQPVEKIATNAPKDCDYRIRRLKIAKLRGDKLHWALIKKFWDEYWEPLKGSKQEMHEFLPRLSKGQRALAALAILKNAMRIGGLQHFFGSQAGADILVSEVSVGLRLIAATPFIAAFGRAVRAGSDLPDMQRKKSDLSRVWRKTEETNDESAIAAARDAWRTAHMIYRKREDEVFDSLDTLSEKFEFLLENANPRLAQYIGEYVRRHPEDFFI